MKTVKISALILDRTKKSYSDSESYPEDGTYFFMETLPEDFVGEEGVNHEAALWCGVSVVRDGVVDYSLLCSGTNEVFKELQKLVKEEVEPPPPQVVEKEIFRHIPNDRGERCIHSFNDVLRALAAAAGALPEGVK